MTNTAKIELPAKMAELFEGKARFRCAKGGRGGGKTRAFALMAAVYGYRFGMEGRRGQILCAREFMNSLSDSSFEEIKTAILSTPFLNNYYECGDRFIRSKDKKIDFTFAGLRHSLDSIKSKSRILLAFVDEAQSVSDAAWVKLIPTVREEDSELMISWNPESKNAAVEKRFTQSDDPEIKLVHINYDDNPWFPQVLEQERLRDKRDRPELYPHIWLGEFLEFADAAYFNEQFIKVRDEKRICNLPIVDNHPVITAWDIGSSDGCAIWLCQKVGMEFRLINFYEAWGKPYSHAVKWLQEQGHVYDQMLLPHDAAHERQGMVDNKSPKAMLEQLMPSANWEIVPRVPEINWGIQHTRDMFPLYWFDEKRCEKGIDHLKAYRRRWSESEKRWMNKPDKAEGHSEAADALRQLAQAYAGGMLDAGVAWGSAGSIKRGIRGIA